MLFSLCAETESSHSPQGPALRTRLGLLPLTQSELMRLLTCCSFGEPLKILKNNWGWGVSRSTCTQWIFWALGSAKAHQCVPSHKRHKKEKNTGEYPNQSTRTWFSYCDPNQNHYHFSNCILLVIFFIAFSMILIIVPICLLCVCVCIHLECKFREGKDLDCPLHCF